MIVSIFVIVISCIIGSASYWLLVDGTLGDLRTNVGIGLMASAVYLPISYVIGANKFVSMQLASWGGIVSRQFSLVWAFGAVAFLCALPCLWWVRQLGFLHNWVSLALRHWRMNWSIGRRMVLRC